MSVSQISDTCLSVFVLIAMSMSLVLADQAKVDVINYYEKAKTHYQAKDFKSAIIELKNALQQNSNDLASYILLGQTYLQMADGAAAEKALRVANRLGADKALTILPLAQAYMLQDNYQTLLARIRPDGFVGTLQADVLVQRGQAYLHLKQWDQAEKSFLAAARVAPRLVDALLGQVSVHLRRSDFTSGKLLIKQVLAMDPNQTQALYFSGSIKHARGDPLGAVADYQRVIVQEPNHIAARIARTGAYIDMKKYMPALVDVTYLHKTFPRDPRGAYLQAVILEKQGKHDAAKTALQTASQVIEGLGPKVLEKHAPTLLLAGLINYSLHQWEKAQVFLSRYMHKFPNQLGVRKLLGAILLSQQDSRKAIRLLEPALLVTQNDYRLLTMLGQAYMQRRQYIPAADMFDRALAIQQHSPDINIQRALNHLASGQSHTALIELTRIFEHEDKKAKSGFILAMLHFKKAEYKAALQVIKKIVAAEPNHLVARNLLAAAYMALGQAQSARQQLNTITAKDATFLPAQFNLGKVEISEGNIDKAQSIFQSILASHPKNIQAMLELGQLAIAKKQRSVALDWFEKAVATDAESLAAKLRLATIYLQLGKNDEALDLVKKSQLQAPNNLSVLTLVARCHLALDKPTIARMVLQKIADQVGYDTPMLVNIARLQRMARDYNAALWSIRKAIDGDAEHLTARVELVALLLSTNQLEQALEQAREVTKTRPGEAIGYRLAGDVYMRQQNYVRAIRNYREAMGKQPDAILAVHLYQAYVSAKQKIAAVDFLAKWSNDHPAEPLPKHALAEAYLRDNQFEKAQQYYLDVLKHDVKQPSVLNNLAYIYTQTGKTDQAMQYAQQALALAPNDPMINDTVGWILVQQQKPDAGLRYLRRAQVSATNDTAIRFHIAVALANLDRREEALQMLIPVLSMGETNPNYQQAMKLKDDLTK